MNFVTLDYFLFLIPVYILYWSIPVRFRLLFLVITSFVFYGMWSPFFATHLGILVFLNYVISIRILSDRNPSTWFFFGIGMDLANLILFKYFYLFADVFFRLTRISFFSGEGINDFLQETTGVSRIVLPLAISFYTFQMIAYLADVRRKRVTTNPGAIPFFAFILFFPQLVAGPIMRHTDFFYQIKAIRFDSTMARHGIFLFLTGLIRKVLVADTIAPFVRDVFDSPEKYDSLSNALAPVGFAIQIYADFSGYTDMARGTGMLFGIRLPKNFNGPFLSPNLQEFWRRWHITLSSWLRDYIYIPLGGSRVSETRTIVSILLTFAIGGIWHGADSTFFIWGLYHGVFLALLRFTDKTRFYRVTDSIPGISVLRAGVTFLLFAGSMVFFHAKDLDSALTMFRQICYSESSLSSEFNGRILSYLPIAFLLNWLDRLEWKRNIPPAFEWLLLYSMGIFTMILTGLLSTESGKFIYFQF